MATVARTARVTPRKKPSKAPRGIVTAIVAVTGVEDQVGDIIQPGIFPAALAKRRPKVVFHHDVKDFVGRIISIEEWLPGDKRLLALKQPNGQPWPAEAGALVATMQFNLNTQRGREVFEWARFYAESGEAAWSIGYMVPPGMDAKRRGIRYIFGIDLFEISLVLHGAHPMTMALEVKSARAAVDAARSMEHKQAPLAIPMPALGGAEQVEELDDDVDHTPPGMRPTTETKGAPGRLVAAGLVVKAADTGRVLLLQRALDATDPASGRWEFPGGHIDGGEDPYAAAVREWREETGSTLPPGRMVHTWDSPNGVYRGFVYVTPTEDLVTLNPDAEDRTTVNPDDPAGQDLEVTAWFDPATLADMPSLREEARTSPWGVIATAGTAGVGMLETKTAGQYDDDVMVALYPDEETANTLSVKGGMAPSDLHVTLAYLGKKDAAYGPNDVITAVQKALAHHAEPLAGNVGGLGVFPGGDDGTPVWAPVDVPGLEKLRERVVDELDAHPTLAGRVARDHGYTPHMTLGFDLPAVDPVPSTPVKFGQAVVVYGNNRYPEPFGAPATGPGVGSLETKAAHLAVQQARALTPALETKMIRMPGSYEEHSRQMNRALTEKFEKPGHGEGESGKRCWPRVEATFDTHVVVTVHSEADDPRTLDFPYEWDGKKVTLGEPVEVVLDFVPAAGAEGPAPDAVDRALVPTLDTLSAAATALGALPLEAKNLRSTYTAVSGLLHVLEGKGMDVLGAAIGDDYDELMGKAATVPMDAEEEQLEDVDDVDPGLEPADLDAELDTAPDEDELSMSLDPADVEEELASLDPADLLVYEDEEAVSLDPADVEAELASLRA